jgi:putative ABC transport system permease protein
MFKTALKFIIFDKPKSVGALAGVIISVFLVGQQVGIFIFLTNAMASLVRNNAEYIWVVDETTTNVNALGALDMRLSRELESVPGVQKSHPLVLAIGSAKFYNGKSSSVTLIGVEHPTYAGGPWNLATGKKEDLLKDGAVFTDFFDRKALGNANIGDYFEINGKKVFIAGQTRGVRGFGGPVYTFTTIERARALGRVENNRASAFLVEYDKSIPQERIIADINRTIKGVRAWKSDDFANESVITVLKSSGIAISFGTLIVFALITGFVIIGLTLYSATIDRIKDYGTLKAIGATNGFVRRLILTQAFILGMVGFGIATALVEGFRAGVANAGTLFSYTPAMRIGFLTFTLVIAFSGSLFAIRRIVKLEPAQVFRG